jgi:hypothetical protein
MAKLHSAPYAVQATAFWAIEACYNQAWAKVLNDGKEELYKEFAHRWVTVHDHPFAGNNVGLGRGNFSVQRVCTGVCLGRAAGGGGG